MKKIIAFFCIITMSVMLTACSGGENHSEEKPPLPEETEEIMSLLAEYADFYWNMFPINGPSEKLIDKSQSISVTFEDGDYFRTFFRVVSGEVQSEEQFMEKLDSLLTQRLKNELLNDPDRLFRFSDGGLYITSVGAGGWGLGMDCLLLDSVEYEGENIIVTVTSFGDKDYWETSEDITNTCSATIVKTSDGFRIDKCDHNIALYFWFYDEILYGDLTIRLDGEK